MNPTSLGILIFTGLLLLFMWFIFAPARKASKDEIRAYRKSFKNNPNDLFNSPGFKRQLEAAHELAMMHEPKLASARPSRPSAPARPRKPSRPASSTRRSFDSAREAAAPLPDPMLDPLNPLNPLSPLSPINHALYGSYDTTPYPDTTPACDTGSSSSSYDSGSSSSYDSGSSSSYDSGSCSYDSGSSSSGGSDSSSW